MQVTRPLGAIILGKFEFFSVLRALNPTPEPIKVKFGREERTYGPLLPAKFDLDRCNVSPLQGEKTQNRPMSKRNTAELPAADPAGKK